MAPRPLPGRARPPVTGDAVAADRARAEVRQRLEDHHVGRLPLTAGSLPGGDS